MCGLVGVAGHLDKDTKAMFEQLLYIDALRGGHSTGMIKASNYTQSLFKKAVMPSEFLQYKQVDAMLTSHGTVLAGHNRYATKGAINSINAHPFEHGKIMGMHNGTLVNQKLLPDHERFDVDSENIVHSIDKIGVMNTIASIDGAAALVWWNKEEKSLNFWRNAQRTLFFAHSIDGATILWASEVEMLELVINRSKGFARFQEPYSMKTEHHVKYTGIDGFKIPKCSVVKTPVYKRPAVVVKTNHAAANQKKAVVINNTGYNRGASKTLAELKKAYPVGSEVKFNIEPNIESPSSIWGKIVGNYAASVRVYLARGDSKRAAIEKAGGTIAGVVDGYTTFNSVPQVTLSAASVVTVVTGKHLENVAYKDSKGAVITSKHWDDLTAAGCECCTRSVYVPAEVGEWIAPNKFYCKSCTDLKAKNTKTFVQKKAVH